MNPIIWLARLPGKRTTPMSAHPPGNAPATPEPTPPRADTSCQDFWRWVSQQKTTNKQRREFIQDTARSLADDSQLCRTITQAYVDPRDRQVYTRMLDEWNRKTGYQPPPHFCPHGRKLHNRRMTHRELAQEIHKTTPA